MKSDIELVKWPRGLSLGSAASWGIWLLMVTVAPGVGGLLVLGLLGSVLFGLGIVGALVAVAFFWVALIRYEAVAQLVDGGGDWLRVQNCRPYEADAVWLS